MQPKWIRTATTQIISRLFIEVTWIGSLIEKMKFEEEGLERK